MREGLGLVALLLVAGPGVLVAAGCTEGRGETAEPNGVDYYLWAWRRPEDLSFVGQESAMVAVWTATVFVEDGALTVEHRTVPVTYPVGTDLVAVTRLEVKGVYGTDVARDVAQAIKAAGAPFGPGEYQVDFDAVRSQRPFYGRLLLELRNLIGDAGLSITALASWCMHDNWIGVLPIDAAVPMVYRLGPQRESILAALRTERGFAEPVCAGNVGYSADEPLVRIDDVERVFLFNPQPWTRERFRTLAGRLEALQ